MTTTKPYYIYFDNAGGIVLRLGALGDPYWSQSYDGDDESIRRCAADLIAYLGGEDWSDWDGNDTEAGADCVIETALDRHDIIVSEVDDLADVTGHTARTFARMVGALSWNLNWN